MVPSLINISFTVPLLEAMKMEQNILANKNGTVKEIYIKEGTTVTPGDVLMSIE